MTDKMTRWMGIPVTAAAAISALAYFGLDLDRYRPVWIYEHNELADTVHNTLYNARLGEYLDISARIQHILDEKKTVPTAFWDRKVWLEIELRRLEGKLNINRPNLNSKPSQPELQ